jgi:hypothetical protein
MKNIRALLVLAVLTIAPIFARAQVVIDSQKVHTLALAVAKAEGFGVKGTVPTRYHNPGDIRSTSLHAYKGQVGLNRCGYVIFKNDKAGFAALESNLILMASGQSKHYGPNMTITKVAKTYATGWKLWAKNVSKTLGVSPTTTLAAYFAPEEIVAPVIEFESQNGIDTISQMFPSIVLPIIAEN